jgi:hypothetical protein
MMIIKISTPFPEWPLIRQTPRSKGEWGDCKFIVDREVEECDWWVVYEGLSKVESTRVVKGNVVFITGEPPTVRKYEPQFLAQFSLIITSHRGIKHPNVVYSQQGLPWHVGRRQVGHQDLGFSKDYDELKAITMFKKEKTLSVISSDRSFTAGHRKRLQFAKALKSHFGERIDLFGRGLNDIEDKWDAIAPYKYHVSLENSSHRDYWTEKLSDAYLGGAYPFYSGCPNLEDYFPSSSFTPIDLADMHRSIEIIEKDIAANTYERAVESIMVARDMVLDKYNLFPMLTDICRKRWVGGEKMDVILTPEVSFRRVTKSFTRILKLSL